MSHAAPAGPDERLRPVDLHEILARARARERVLLALSGGADSMALLHILRFGPAALAPGRFLAAHFDHRMRPDSAADAAWVRGVCTAWEVPLVEGAAEVPPTGETSARVMRWDFLLEAARSTGAGVIVTAHHADDQAETVLHRVVRGTGLAGLAGIAPERTVRVGGRRVRIIRPLLGVRRDALRAYCVRHRVRWREDPTNLLPMTPRNVIRLHLLPALEAAAPGATERLVRLATLARAAEHAWDAALEDVRADVIRERGRDRIVLARQALLDYDPQVRRRVLRQELRRFGSVPGRAATEAVDAFVRSAASGKSMTLTGGLRVERDRDRIVVRRERYVPSDRPLEIPAPVAGSGVARIAGRRIAARWAPGSGPDGADTLHVDPTTLAFPLMLRRWRPGDRIRLRYGSKKLKKLFLERGLSRFERERRPVLADAAGRVLWVPGIARAHDIGPVEGAAGFHIVVGE
ncbi:MAG: tRNA lysidine(34) synthetase TilS [Candidatus Cloacimonetes bacterium]|nr:tRNA lysidine(34) synthetase TilS [Candidatus Cloacimonadota bacterium]